MVNERCVPEETHLLSVGGEVFHCWFGCCFSVVVNDVVFDWMVEKLIEIHLFTVSFCGRLLLHNEKSDCC